MAQRSIFAWLSAAWLCAACTTAKAPPLPEAAQAVSAAGLAPSAQPEQSAAVAQQSVESVVSYRISARLDTSNHSVDGRERISLRNISNRPLHELYFHLYLNAFENEQTLFLREGGGRSGGTRGRYGSVTVKALRSPSYPEQDLWRSAAKHSPGDARDRTDIRVPLPTPLAAGATLELDLEFTAQLPEFVERTGYARDFHMLGQWFPKLAKLEESGQWTHFAFHSFAEFYANFGSYDVELDVPANYTVGSTGTLARKPSPAPERARYHAHADRVHDFAWTAWPHFEEYQQQLPGGPLLRILTPRHAAETREQLRETISLGLEFLGRAYGAYPHPTLTVVLPPAYARPAMGMEYPGFITVAGDEVSARLDVRAIELVAIHELAHQWFQGMLASNEAAAPFLDEGLTSYAEWEYLRWRFGSSSLAQLGPLSLDREGVARYFHLRAQHDQPIHQPAARFRSFNAISSLVYTRTPLLLMSFAGAWGHEAVREALAHYAVQQRFRHPEASDLYRAVRERLGRDAERQFRLAFDQQGTLDLKIANVSSSARPRAPGAKRWRTRFDVQKVGELSLPYEVALRTRSGKMYVLRGSGEPESFSVDHDAPLASIQIDPSYLLKIDENYLNNRYWVDHPGPESRAPHALLCGVRLLALLSSWGAQ